jgi:hypothetical protein
VDKIFVSSSAVELEQLPVWQWEWVRSSARHLALREFLQNMTDILNEIFLDFKVQNKTN